MEALLAKYPDINGVIAGNDEMALGAINALKEANKLQQVKVLGFDGNQDAVNAVKSGEMVASVLQPIVEGTTKAVAQLDSVIKTGNTGVARREAGAGLHADQQGQRRQGEQLRARAAPDREAAGAADPDARRDIRASEPVPIAGKGTSGDRTPTCSA